MPATSAPLFRASGRGQLILALLTAVGFLDFADASIDLLGRRRVLIVGTLFSAVSSLTGGFAADSAAVAQPT